VNVANQVQLTKEYTAGQSTFNIQVGLDPTVNILDRDTLYCEYNNYSRIRVLPRPSIGATSIFTIFNRSTNRLDSIIPNSLGEVYINPAFLDADIISDTRFKLTYSYSELGCSRSDSINILIPEPLNASFMPNINTQYCVSGLDVALVPTIPDTTIGVNRNNTFFSVDNISNMSDTIRPH
jgi:hypothetical protein